MTAPLVRSAAAIDSEDRDITRTSAPTCGVAMPTRVGAAVDGCGNQNESKQGEAKSPYQVASAPVSQHVEYRSQTAQSCYFGGKLIELMS